MGFNLLGLSDAVLSAVSDAGYTEPTPIQKQAIPNVLQGRDILGIAQTGTGKTASFTLPMIDVLSHGRARARMPRSLILEPTRELAAQVAENFETYGKNSKLSMALLIGGVSFADQEKKLDRGVDVLIATPGRLLDHFERGKLMLTGVEILVVDEADRMLDMGFIPDVERICSLIPQKMQALFFSATMPKEVKRLTDRFLNDPKQIEVARASSTASTITQKMLKVAYDPNEKTKRAALRHLIQSQDVKNAIIFCNRKKTVQVVNTSLKKHGFNVAELHGDMHQSSRMEVLENFKNGTIQLLVASDVAARGLDIPEVSHVFNYEVPISAEDYVHRIGRTGRAGREGHAFTIFTPKETKFVEAINKLIKKEIPVAELEEFSNSARKKTTKSKTTKTKKEEAVKENLSQEAVDAEPINTPQKRSASSTPTKNKDKHKEKEETGRGSRNRQKPVVGLGDHVPAFLLRTAPKATPEKKKSTTPRRRKTVSENNVETAVTETPAAEDI